jgi:hypothetical protein
LQLRAMNITYETILRPLGVLLAGLACGHALGQDVGTHESASLRGMAVRTVAELHVPLEPRRVYGDTHAGLRFGGQSALPERAPRIGVAFAAAPAPALGLDRGALLRAKLSESTQLSLRAHHRGLGVVLRSEF